MVVKSRCHYWNGCRVLMFYVFTLSAAISSPCYYHCVCVCVILVWLKTFKSVNSWSEVSEPVNLCVRDLLRTSLSFSPSCIVFCLFFFYSCVVMMGERRLVTEWRFLITCFSDCFSWADDFDIFRLFSFLISYRLIMEEKAAIDGLRPLLR